MQIGVIMPTSAPICSETAHISLGAQSPLLSHCFLYEVPDKPVDL